MDKNFSVTKNPRYFATNTDVNSNVVKGPEVGQRSKYKGPMHPLLAEKHKNAMEAPPNVRYKERNRIYKDLELAVQINPNMSEDMKQAQLVAIETARRGDIDKLVNAEIDDDFANSFRNWVMKRGRVQDHIEAGWWPKDQKAVPKFLQEGGLLSEHDSVKRYVGDFVMGPLEFNKHLQMMKLQAKGGGVHDWPIDMLYYYYKFVVRGLEPDDDDRYQFGLGMQKYRGGNGSGGGPTGPAPVTFVAPASAPRRAPPSGAPGARSSVLSSASATEPRQALQTYAPLDPEVQRLQAELAAQAAFIDKIRNEQAAHEWDVQQQLEIDRQRAWEEVTRKAANEEREKDWEEKYQATLERKQKSAQMKAYDKRTAELEKQLAEETNKLQYTRQRMDEMEKVLTKTKTRYDPQETAAASAAPAAAPEVSPAVMAASAGSTDQPPPTAMAPVPTKVTKKSPRKPAAQPAPSSPPPPSVVLPQTPPTKSYLEVASSPPPMAAKSEAAARKKKPAAALAVAALVDLLGEPAQKPAAAAPKPAAPKSAAVPTGRRSTRATKK